MPAGYSCCCRRRGRRRRRRRRSCRLHSPVVSTPTSHHAGRWGLACQFGHHQNCGRRRFAHRRRPSGGVSASAGDTLPPLAPAALQQCNRPRWPRHQLLVARAGGLWERREAVPGRRRLTLNQSRESIAYTYTIRRRAWLICPSCPPPLVPSLHRFQNSEAPSQTPSESNAA